MIMAAAAIATVWVGNWLVSVVDVELGDWEFVRFGDWVGVADEIVDEIGVEDGLDEGPGAGEAAGNSAEVTEIT
jgi:hypothetical protein